MATVAAVRSTYGQTLTVRGNEKGSTSAKKGAITVTVKTRRHSHKRSHS